VSVVVVVLGRCWYVVVQTKPKAPVIAYQPCNMNSMMPVGNMFGGRQQFGMSPMNMMPPHRSVWYSPFRLGQVPLPLGWAAFIHPALMPDTDWPSSHPPSSQRSHNSFWGSTYYLPSMTSVLKW